MMTLTPQLSFTATNSGINESNALDYWNSRTVADDFRDFFDKTVLKGINTNFVFRRGLAGINLIRIPFVDSHYDNNKNLKFDDYITDQLTGNAAKAKMGFDFLGSNACGWVAVYNALVSIDNYKHPADIIRYIENHDGLIADGIFGVNPAIYDDLLKYYGLKTKTTFFNDKELNRLAQSGKTAILTYGYVRKTGDIGAHNIAITWNEATGKYDAYNPEKQEFSSIYDFMNNTANGKRHFISLTTIY